MDLTRLFSIEVGEKHDPEGCYDPKAIVILKLGETEVTRWESDNWYALTQDRDKKEEAEIFVAHKFGELFRKAGPCQVS